MRFGFITGILCLLISGALIWVGKINIYQLSTDHFMGVVFGLGVGLIIGNLYGYFKGKSSGKRNAMRKFEKDTEKLVKQAREEAKKEISDKEPLQTL